LALGFCHAQLGRRAGRHDDDFMRYGAAERVPCWREPEDDKIAEDGHQPDHNEDDPEHGTAAAPAWCLDSAFHIYLLHCGKLLRVTIPLYARRMSKLQAGRWHLA